MSNIIKCKNCGNEIEISEALTHQIQEQVLASERDKHKKELDDVRKIAEEKAIRKVGEENELQIKTLKEEKNEEKERVKKLQDQIIEITKEIREARREAGDIKAVYEKKLKDDEEKIKQDAVKTVSEDYRLKGLEKEKQINDMRKQIEDLKRKAEQGSQQTQGEVLELEIEQILRNRFPIDNISPVPKGVAGADVTQVVNDKGALECGKIIWESKRAKSWGSDWIGKLKDDQREMKADIAILVTTILPTGINNFGMMNGVWVSDYSSFEGLATALRISLIQLASVKRSSVGKNEKIEALYSYLNGPEFIHKIEAIVESFSGMKQELEQEKRVLTKVWARREKQIDRVINNTIGLYGDVQALSGNKLPQIENLELKTLVSGSDDVDTV